MGQGVAGEQQPSGPPGMHAWIKYQVSFRFYQYHQILMKAKLKLKGNWMINPDLDGAHVVVGGAAGPGEGVLGPGVKH